MKIAFDREKFLEEFTAVASVASGKVKSVLGNVRLKLSDGKATLFGTDTEISIVREVEAKAALVAEGDMLLPASRVSQILREATSDDIEIETKGDSIRIFAGGAKYEIGAEDPETFPVPVIEKGETCTMDARVLLEGIKRTVFAIDVASTRFAMGGIRLEIDSEEASFVGTDGRRLACFTHNGEFGVKEAVSYLIPARGCQAIQKAVGAGEGAVQIGVSGASIVVLTQRGYVLSRMLEGRYPAWRQVLPKLDGYSEVPMLAGPFHSAVRQAAICSEREGRGLDFVFSEGQLSVSGSEANSGQSRVDMPVAYAGDEVEIRLDHVFVTDFLRVLDPETEVRVHLKSGKFAVQLSSDGYRYVVMPMSREG